MTNHCPQNGVALTTAELPVNDCSPATRTVVDPGAGNRRGFIVNMHGLDNGTAPTTTYPPAIPNFSSGSGADRTGDFATAVVADGWVFVYPCYQEDFYSLQAGAFGLYADVQNDAGNGTRYLSSTVRWFDHLQADLLRVYGHAGPIVIMGFSWGAIRALQIAANRQSQLIGYIAHCAPTLNECVSPLFTDTENWAALNWSGFNIGATFLSSSGITIPGIWGYGTSDEAVGYNGATTVAAGSNGVDVSTFAGAGVLNLTDISTIVAFNQDSPLVKVATSNGFAYINFLAKGAGQLTSCTTVAGTGTLSTGAAVIQSTQVAAIADGVSHSLPITGNPIAEVHEFSSTDATTYAAWVASTMDPLAPANAF